MKNFQTRRLGLERGVSLRHRFNDRRMNHKKSDEYISHMVAIVESSEDAIISKSPDGIIRSWNKGAETMFGYNASEIVGKHISIIIPDQYDEDEKTIISRIYKNEVINHLETERRKKNGECFFVSITLAALRDPNGKIIGISKIIRDIDARKRSEAALALAARKLDFENQEKSDRASELLIANIELLFQNEEKEKRAAELGIANCKLAIENEEKEQRAHELILANAELLFQNGEKEKRAAELLIANQELAYQNVQKEERARELILVNSELAQKEISLKKHNEELEQFAYVASHDLQEPLRTVSNYMAVMIEDYGHVLDDKGISHLTSVTKATNRMSNLIKSLLEFSRLGNNSKIAHVDCEVIISEVLADLNTVIVKSKALIEIGAMPTLNAYEVELGQVFQNLITNAIKFQRIGVQPWIRIGYSHTSGVHLFSVTDNGIGIDPSHFEHVFKIFQRLPTDIVYEGSGIGLANCRKIVHLHQGEISIESIPGELTTVYFTIGNLMPGDETS